MPHTRLATSHGASAGAGPLAETPCEPIAVATMTRTMVPTASLSRLKSGLRMAGAVQKMPSLAAGSGVWLQCGPQCSDMSVAPQIAPSSCADQ